MKLIYCCYGGAHSSPVAAAIHLGWLPETERPSPEQILALPRFDRVSSDEFGVPEQMGVDEDGHEVYVMGRGDRPEVVERAVLSGVRLAGSDPSQVVFVSTLECVNLAMRIGGFLSRTAGLPRWGRPIVLWGTCRAYADLVKLVQKTKRFLRQAREVERI